MDPIAAGAIRAVPPSTPHRRPGHPGQASSRLRSCPSDEHRLQRRRRCCARRASRCRWRPSRVLAGGCGASLGGRYDSATTAPGACVLAGATAGGLRVVTAQPLPALDPAFADTRQARAVVNALCTPLVRYADASGLPGTVIVPGLARDLPIISRGSRTFRFQLLAGLHFADGRRLTTEDVRATFERLLDPATRSPGAALFHDIVGANASRTARARTCAACAPTAARSRSRSSARIRRSWRGWPCRSRVRSRAAPRTGRFRDCLRASRPAATASSRARPR